MRQTASILALGVLLLSLPTARAADAVRVDWGKWKTVNTSPVAAESRCTVVCFLGSECPLARLYGPRLNQMAAQLKSQGVRFIGVNSNTQDSAEDVLHYAQEYGVDFPLIKDVKQELGRQFGATRTPEVFVLDAEGRVRYQGRIDDQYQPGAARSKPTRHDLRDAVAAVLAGKEVVHAVTKVEGCLITYRTQPTGVKPTVTFSRDVAPILNRHCVECHRQGEIGPFALTDYDEVVGWGQMMLEVIDDGRMPPWHADPQHGKFVGARSFPSTDRRTIASWITQGMPEGDPADLPPQPKLGAGWHLASEPDQQFQMRERPYRVPAEGIVEYQYFVVDPQWTEDKWVRAAQVIPGNASVVHHSIVFVRPPDGSYVAGIGWMGSYVPGQRASLLPPGHARLVPAGSKLIFQMHYTPNGRQTEDVTKVGVWFAEPEKVTHEVVTQLALDQKFEIEPGNANKSVTLRLDYFSPESRLLSASPHMHLRGKSFSLEAVRGDKKETLLSVPRYDFNWQHWYRFESPPDLDEIDALEMTVTFDNSRHNPVNPAPDEYVHWGDQTGEEMALAYFDVAYPRGGSKRRRRVVESVDLAARAKRIQKAVDEFLKKMDKDGDGVVAREEAPFAFRRYGFWRMDRNRDRKIDRQEIEEAAAQRQ